MFSAFIIVTFVYYLPLLFLHTQTGGQHVETAGEHTSGEMMPHMDEHMEEMMDGMMVDEHAQGESAAHGHGESAYHEETSVTEGLVVNLNVTPSPVQVGNPVKLDFFVNVKPGNVPVTNLEIGHERLIHVIGVRDDMNEFFHIHPDAVPERPGFFSIERTFAKPGIYKLWSDVKQGGKVHSFGHPKFTVDGEGSRSEKSADLGTNVIVGDYQVALDYGGKIISGQEADITFEIRSVTGTPVAVEPYLAAPMHLTVIKDDLRVYIHAHPEEEHGHGAAKPIIPRALANGGGHSEDPAEQISFHLSFPEAGIYKLFAQFRPAGIALPSDKSLVAGFYVQVEPPKGILAYSNWWTNLIVSLIIIFFLSIGVKRFITIKR
jgi:hypothetical protein